jgi:choline-sulfatase
MLRSSPLLPPPSIRRPRWGVGASVFAGVLGAGVVDILMVLLRGPGVPKLELCELALGIYGTAGLIIGILAALAVRATLGAIPGGPDRFASDPYFDEQVATAVFAGMGGTLATAGLTAIAQGLFVSAMASKRLAVIATFGLALAFIPVGVVVALALRRPAGALARMMPYSRRLGRTGFVILVLLAGGLAAGVFSISRADWRVLDLGGLESAGIAIVLGTLHGLFWYGFSVGRHIHRRLPVGAIRAVMAVAVMALFALSSHISEDSPTYEAIDDAALGLRFGLKVARALTDGDHDGFSARFGGGDCDDKRADVFPGADDVPNDGIDQDCEGGDATTVEEPVAAAATPEPPPAKPARGAFTGNILIISIDTLRADRLGVAGYGRPSGRSLTPTLDNLARRGAYFRRAWAQAPNTPRSFPSLVTSRYPSDIAWQQRTLNYSPLLPTNHTFFEPLAKAGWKPIGIFSHFYFTADRGLSRGFAEWTNDGAGSIADSNKDVAAPRIVPRVIGRLARAAANKERFVMWTHLFEPHASYMEHREFPLSGRSGLAGLEERYDYEIAYVDRWVGKIMTALEGDGLADNTVVVILADHGEAWGEHKRFFHGQDLTEEQLRVPLIIAVPGHRPTVIDDEVALVDVGPTLLDLVGLRAPPYFRGRSLLPRIEGKPLPPRPVFAELLPANAWPRHEVMVVDRGRKMTHRITDRRYDLFDLRTDPRQQKNLIEDGARRAMAEELKARLRRFQEGRR